MLMGVLLSVSLIKSAFLVKHGRQTVKSKTALPTKSLFLSTRSSN